MSAYIVNREHIAYLIEAALSRAIIKDHGSMDWYLDDENERFGYKRFQLPMGNYDRATEVGQMLWDENIKSVSYRYDDCQLDNLPGPVGETFVFEFCHDWRRQITPVQVLKACNGYIYQSCEHPGWKTSEAKAFIDSLKDYAVCALPGYQEAHWEITAA